MKPTALKVLQGNPGRRPLNEHEPQPGTLDDLRPPSWMDATAKRCWREVAGELARMHLLTAIDRNQLALYCQAYSRYRAALAAMAKPPESLKDDDRATVDYQMAWAVRLEKAEAAMRLLGTDFGMNPASRSKLSVKPAQSVDPFEEFLRGGSRSTG